MQRTQHIKRRHAERGMTIVEVVVVIVIMGIMFPMFTLVINMYHDAFYLNDKVSMDATTMQGLWYMDDTVRVAHTFKANVPSPYSDAYGPHNSGTAGGEAWSYKGNSATSRVLITQSYSTTTNALSSGRQAVFINTPEFNCTTEMSYQPQLSFISIYFVRDSVLYKRTLTDTTTTLCAGNSQQQRQSCPPEIAIGLRHVSCQANDEILATKVSGFTLAYYQISQDGSSTQIDPTFTSSDSTILDTADYAIATITTSTKGGAVTSTLSQRLTKVNQQ